MDKGMALEDIPEPKDLKEKAKKEKEGTDMDMDSLYVWFGNRLPKYIWNYWKEDLKKQGITWQKFLKIMSYVKVDIILWLRDKESWNELLDKLRKTIEAGI